MLMRYWAKATLSALPLMVMVLSRLAGASLSSQLEILIIAPESCLQKVMLLLCMGILVGTFIGKQSLHWRKAAAKSLLTSALHKHWYCSSKSLAHLISATLEPPLPMMQPMSSLGTVISWLCCWLGFLACPVRRARAEMMMELWTSLIIVLWMMMNYWWANLPAGFIIPLLRGFTPLITLMGSPTLVSCWNERIFSLNKIVKCKNWFF